MAAILSIVSPFNKTISSFDDEDSFPDIFFTFPGLEKPLNLHRRDLGSASMTISASIKGQANEFVKFDKERQTIEWIDERTATNATYRNVLMKWLRFCYGEDQTFSADECPMALTISSQLQLRFKDKIEESDIRTSMEQRMIDSARKNANTGAQMLSVCLRELRIRDGLKAEAVAEPKEQESSDKKIKTMAVKKSWL